MDFQVLVLTILSKICAEFVWIVASTLQKMGYTLTLITSRKNAKLKGFHVHMPLFIVVIPLTDPSSNIGKLPIIIIGKTVEGKRALYETEIKSYQIIL